MFGLSLGKLLILAVCAWFGWSLFKALGAPPKAAPRPQPRQAPPPQPSAPAIQAEEMIPCAVCGTYVAAQGAVPCGQRDCPVGR